MFEDAFTNGKLEVLLHNYFIFWNKVWNCVLKVVTLEPPLDWKVLKTALWGKENKGNADYLYLCKEEKNTYNQILGQEILFSQLSFFFFSSRNGSFCIYLVFSISGMWWLSLCKDAWKTRIIEHAMNWMSHSMWQCFQCNSLYLWERTSLPTYFWSSAHQVKCWVAPGMLLTSAEGTCRPGPELQSIWRWIPSHILHAVSVKLNFLISFNRVNRTENVQKKKKKAWELTKENSHPVGLDWPVLTVALLES